MATSKNTKKKELNVDRLEQLINKFQKKKTLSKPSSDLMSSINQRIQNVKSKSKSIQKQSIKDKLEKAISKPKKTKIEPKKVTQKPNTKIKSPKKTEVNSHNTSNNISNDNQVVNEINEMLKLEDERKKNQIKTITSEEKLKREYLDTFNKDKPPLNNNSVVKIPRRSRKKVVQQVDDNKVRFSPDVNLVTYDVLEEKTNKRKPSKKVNPPKRKTQINRETLQNMFTGLQNRKNKKNTINFKDNIKANTNYINSPKKQSSKSTINYDSNILKLIPPHLKNQISPEMILNNPYIRRDLEQQYKHTETEKLKELKMQREREKYLMQKQLFEEREKRKKLEKQQYEMYQRLKKEKMKPKRNPKYTFKEPTNTMDIKYSPRYKRHKHIKPSYQQNIKHETPDSNVKIISSSLRTGSSNQNRGQHIIQKERGPSPIFIEPKTQNMIKTIAISDESAGYLKGKTKKEIIKDKKQQDKTLKTNLQDNLNKMIEARRNKNGPTTNDNNRRVVKLSDTNNYNTINNNKPIITKKEPELDIRSLLMNLASKNSIEEIKEQITMITSGISNSSDNLDFLNQLENIKNKIENPINQSKLLNTNPSSIKITKDTSSKFDNQPLKTPKKTSPRKRRSRNKTPTNNTNKQNLVKNMINQNNNTNKLQQQRMMKILMQKRASQKKHIFNNFRWENQNSGEVINIRNKRSWKHYKLVNRLRKPYHKFKINGDIMCYINDIPNNMDTHLMIQKMVEAGILKIKDRFRNLSIPIYKILFQLTYKQNIKIRYMY
jgi:hypothetical protein